MSSTNSVSVISISAKDDGGFDYAGDHYDSDVAVMTAVNGAYYEFEYFVFSTSGLSTDPDYYQGDVGVVDTLYYTPSTTDPFVEHTIYLDYVLVRPGANDESTSPNQQTPLGYYNNIWGYFAEDPSFDGANPYVPVLNFLTSVDVKASFGPVYPAVNNGVVQSVNIASILYDAALLGDDLIVYAYENDGGFSQVSDMTIMVVQCYVAGTRILLDRGDVLIEQVRVGDMAVTTVTESGSVLRPVRWVGKRRIGLRHHPDRELVAPIRIRRDAIASGVPARDLLVSPDHAVCVDGVLIPARRLLNGSSIVQLFDRPFCTYHHIELDQHALLLAESMPAESYRSGQGLSAYAREGRTQALHPGLHEFGQTQADEAMPLATDEPTIEAVYRRIAARAVRGNVARQASPTAFVTTNPDLRLRFDGRELKPIHVAVGCAAFVLPRGSGTGWLLCNTARPTMTRPWLDDRRRLGIAVRRIELDYGAVRHVIPLDHPALSDGWWEPETSDDAVFRWTRGEAALPDLTGARIVTVQFDALDAYPTASAVPRQVARIA
jgi:hypothetical protein